MIMRAENIITIFTAILSSGVLSLLLQRYWAKVDEKKAKEREQSEEVQKERAERELNNKMLKKLYRTNLERTINFVREKLEDIDVSESRLRLYVTELRDDMNDYFEMGGNGATHAAYLELYREIEEKKPELISVAWIDQLSRDIRR